MYIVNYCFTVEMNHIYQSNICDKADRLCRCVSKQGVHQPRKSPPPPPPLKIAECVPFL